MGQVISDLKAELFSLFSFKQACLVLFLFYVHEMLCLKQRDELK